MGLLDATFYNESLNPRTHRRRVKCSIPWEDVSPEWISQHVASIRLTLSSLSPSGIIVTPKNFVLLMSTRSRSTMWIQTIVLSYTVVNGKLYISQRLASIHLYIFLCSSIDSLRLFSEAIAFEGTKSASLTTRHGIVCKAQTRRLCTAISKQMYALPKAKKAFV